jgi:hypothetical protein
LGEPARAQPLARASARALSDTGRVSRSLAEKTRERVSVANPAGPEALSVTRTGARAVSVTTIADCAVTRAAARELAHAREEPIPTVGGPLEEVVRSKTAIPAAATSSDRTTGKRGGRRGISQ